MVLYIVLSPQKEFVDNVVIQEPLGSSDHNQLHFNINIKSDRTKVKHCRRDFRKGNYKEIRKSLALIDRNDKMKNKTTTECWNILRGELDKGDCIIMGDFNHGNQTFVCLVQDNFLTQHVLEPTRATMVLDIVLSS